jgi:putative pyruvate formate lyase activating enzyme
MHAQVGDLIVDEEGLAVRGLLVRHLVMPGLLDDTREILRWLAKTLSPDTFVNVMDQFHPAWMLESDPRFCAARRHITPAEYRQAMEAAREAGLWRFDTRWRHQVRLVPTSD